VGLCSAESRTRDGSANHGDSLFLSFTFEMTCTRCGWSEHGCRPAGLWRTTRRAAEPVFQLPALGARRIDNPHVDQAENISTGAGRAGAQGEFLVSASEGEGVWHDGKRQAGKRKLPPDLWPVRFSPNVPLVALPRLSAPQACACFL
jgi:hypothetical protein